MKWKQKQLALAPGPAALGEWRVCPASPTEFPELSGQMEKCHISLVRSRHGGEGSVSAAVCAALASCRALWASGRPKETTAATWHREVGFSVGMGDGWASHLHRSTGVLSAISRS